MIIDNQAIKSGSILNKKLLKSKNPAFITANARQTFT